MRDLLIELSIMFAIALALAALGPFGSFAIGDFATRLAYWLPSVFIGYAIFRPVTALARLIAERLHFHWFAALGATVVLAAVPGTFAMLLLGGYRPGETPDFSAVFQLYLNVLLLGAIITLIFVLLSRGESNSTRGRAFDTRVKAPTPMSPEPSSPAFHDRLPPAWNGRLVALEMEDHYVRAHGPGGQSILVLLRMADAERELAGCDGARVHRSWWVAREAVTGRSREGRNLRLKLDHGLEAPVARDRIAELRSKGWLA